MTIMATAAVEPTEPTTEDEADTRAIPPEVLALVPDAHPDRAGILADLARFYATGGFAVRERAAAILRDAHERPATTAAA